MDEKTKWIKTVHPYIQAKRATEKLIKNLHLNKDLPVVVIQPTIVYGPYCNPWTLRIINQFKTGITPLINKGHGLCNAVYIDDVVEALILAATKTGINGETFLISGENPITFHQFFLTFEKIFKKKRTIGISNEELKDIKRQKRHQDSALFRIRDFINTIRKPDVAKSVINLPIISTIYDIVKASMPEKRWNIIKDGFINYTEDERPVENNILLPEDVQLELYKSKSIVKIEKAKNLLKYNPKYNFDQGMKLTAEYIKWANLV